MHSHPLQSVERSRSALLLLDSLMRLFSLSTVDEGIKPRGRGLFKNLRPMMTPFSGFNPAAQLGFVPNLTSNAFNPQMPMASGSNFNENIASMSPGAYSSSPNSSTSSPSPTSSDHSQSSGHSHSNSSGQHRCNCHALSLGTNWPSVYNIAPALASSIMWPEGLAEGDFKREEARRLVWCCVITVGNLHAYIAATPDSTVSLGHRDIFVRESENVSVLPFLAHPGRCHPSHRRYADVLTPDSLP